MITIQSGNFFFPEPSKLKRVNKVWNYWNLLILLTLLFHYYTSMLSFPVSTHSKRSLNALFRGSDVNNSQFIKHQTVSENLKTLGTDRVNLPRLKGVTIEFYPPDLIFMNCQGDTKNNRIGHLTQIFNSKRMDEWDLKIAALTYSGILSELKSSICFDLGFLVSLEHLI